MTKLWLRERHRRPRSVDVFDDGLPQRWKVVQATWRSQPKAVDIGCHLRREGKLPDETLPVENFSAEGVLQELARSCRILSCPDSDLCRILTVLRTGEPVQPACVRRLGAFVRLTENYADIQWMNGRLDHRRDRVASDHKVLAYLDVPSIFLAPTYQIEISEAELNDTGRFLDACRRQGITHLFGNVDSFPNLRTHLRRGLPESLLASGRRALFSRAADRSDCRVRKCVPSEYQWIVGGSLIRGRRPYARAIARSSISAIIGAVLSQ